MSIHIIGRVYVNEIFLEGSLVRSIKILNVTNSEAALRIQELILWKYLHVEKSVCANMYIVTLF